MLYKDLIPEQDIKISNTVVNNIVSISVVGASLTAVDASIDGQICTVPTSILNVSLLNASTSATYNSIKWFFYERSGSDLLLELSANDPASYVYTGTNYFKAITIPRETLKNTIVASSLSATVKLPVTGTVMYIKDEPDVSTYGTSLYRGNLKIMSSPTGSVTESLTSVGEVFYSYGTLIFRGNVCGDTALGSFMGATPMQFLNSGGSATGSINITQLSFKREQPKTKKIYFCRALNNEFNYSLNKSYRDSYGVIHPYITDLGNMTFATTVGLYNDAGELLLIGKINPVEKKTDEDEIVFKLSIVY